MQSLYPSIPSRQRRREWPDAALGHVSIVTKRSFLFHLKVLCIAYAIRAWRDGNKRQIPWNNPFDGKQRRRHREKRAGIISFRTLSAQKDIPDISFAVETIDRIVTLGIELQPPTATLGYLFSKGDSFFYLLFFFQSNKIGYAKMWQ